MASDLARVYPSASVPNLVKALVLYPPFLSIFLFRVSKIAYGKNEALGRLVSRINLTLNGIDIDPRAEIGEGVLFQHPVGVVVGGGASIGDFSTLMGSVTLGRKVLDGGAGFSEYPAVGACVTIGAGATLIGSINIADHSIIGANSVVVSDTTVGSTVVGNPARIVQTANMKGE